MRKPFAIMALTSFAIGSAILLYDAYYILNYGEDVNDIEIVQQGKTFGWPTGERPFYTVFPATIYGAIFWLLAAIFLVKEIWSKRK